MNKKFLSAVLFGALMASSMGTFTSCKDYDDDINDLWDAVDGKASIEDLKSKVSEMETALNEAKSASQEALEKAKEANDAVKIAAAEAKQAAIEAAQKEVSNLKSELESTINASQSQLEALQTKVENTLKTVAKLVGSRVTSVNFVPKTNINGIPAMEFLSLSYTPQVYHANGKHDSGKHDTQPVLDHQSADKAVALTISSDETIAYYHLNPSMGVTKEDIDGKKIAFDCITATNTSRAVTDKNASKNSPIKPVENQEINLENGILKLRVTKSVTDNIDAEGSVHGTDNSVGGKEKFYMASLKVAVSEKNWTEEEKDAVASGKMDGVYVNSEYVRLAETVVQPYILNSKVDVTKATTGNFADETQVDTEGNSHFVHYQDSVCVYESPNNARVDVEYAYNQPLDLKTLVAVCGIHENDTEHNAHELIDNYKAYGLEFRFDLAKAPYLQGSNKTDEQEFAKIDNSVNGIMTSKVYSEGGDGNSRAAIGREPIVRVSLIDTKHNNNLVAQRYIKVRWSEQKKDQQLSYTFLNDTISCDDMFRRLGTQEMNEQIYHKVEGPDGKGSISKTDFHNQYKQIKVISLKKDGVAIDLSKIDVFSTENDAWDINSYWIKNTADNNHMSINNAKITNAGHQALLFAFIPDEKDNTSYNIVWAMTPELVGKIKDAKTSKFEIEVQYVSELLGTVTHTLTQNIDIPAQKFTYQGTYWQAGQIGKVFNVNPIVYNTKDDGALENVTDADHSKHTLGDYSHIDADLVNGFVYEPTKTKPANLAQFISYIRHCAEVRVEFDDAKFANYDYLKGYVTNDNKNELWNAAVGKTQEYGKYIQPEGCAATIENIFNATAKENQENLPWNLDETLGKIGSDTKGNASSYIRLAELDEQNATEAAKVLVGKSVPVKLVVEYNKANAVTVKEFEVFFINPLTINGELKGDFQDAVINGSFVNAEEGLTFTDWNKYTVAKADIAKPETEKDKYAHTLWHYYWVKDVVFDVKNVKTNLGWNADKTALIPSDVKDGPLPGTGAYLIQADADKKEVENNPVYLGYFNDKGTPVNLDYKLYVDVKVTYKWGTLSKEAIELNVKPADGTPDEGGK